MDHAAVNVALYGRDARWAMTERPAGDVSASKSELTIGPSAVRWTGEALEIMIAERDKRVLNPFRRPLYGTVRVIPEALNPLSFALSPDEQHIWHCMAPRARIEVDMGAPSVSWRGSGYLDHNRGSQPLEDGFKHWHWSRAHLKNGSVVCYEGERRDGSRFASALKFEADGLPEVDELPARAFLPRTRWGLHRKSRSDPGYSHLLKTWEDTPFYARSTIGSQMYGERVVAVQETLDMDRFKSPMVQWMLPFRMPRKPMRR